MGKYSNMCCKIYYISIKIHQQSIISSSLKEREREPLSCTCILFSNIYMQNASQIEVDFAFKFIEIRRTPRLLLGSSIF